MEDFLRRELTNAVTSGALVVALQGPNLDGWAQQWARVHRREFMGGYLAVDLNAYRIPGGVALPEVLCQCLRALDAVNLPLSFGSRAVMYRDYVMRHGRMVIGLDNADQAAQVRPFVVPNSVVIVSSRRKLGGLITENAYFIEV